MHFGNNNAGQRASFGSRGQQPQQQQADNASDDVMAILEAANDLGDRETVAVCRRVIEAKKTGAAVSPMDMQIILNYFR